MPAKLLERELIAPSCPYCGEPMDWAKLFGDNFGNLVYYRCFCDGYCEAEEALFDEGVQDV